MRIYFLKPACAVGFGYREHETADLPEEAANKLIEGGYAVAMKEKKKANPETRESKYTPETRATRRKKKQ